MKLVFNGSDSQMGILKWNTEAGETERQQNRKKKRDEDPEGKFELGKFNGKL